MAKILKSIRPVFKLTILLAAIFLTAFLIQFFDDITGFSTTALGTSDIEIQGGLDIKLSDNTIDFRNGTVLQGKQFAILESNGSATINGSWAAVDDSFVVENSGSVLANISIKASLSAANWFGGNPIYSAMYYRYLDSETGACLLDSGIVKNRTWGTLPVDPAVNGTCQKLNFTDTSDQMRVDLKVHVPSDAAPGVKQNTITFTSTESA